jgi:AraC family transcriptional regulator of adaptative response / DNA-3-methyladenine glycosylase II
VAQTRRVLFAKKLIDETQLPMAQVGLSAGFASIRRFNDAIRSTYGRTPRELRGKRRPRPSDKNAWDLDLKLAYRPPYAWASIAGFLALRAIPGVEAVTPEAYRRTFRFRDGEGLLEVSPDPDAHQLRAKIRIEGAAPLQTIAERTRRIFDLGADPTAIAAHLSLAPQLRDAVDALPGIRVPGAWDGFELAVRAVLGQQVSVKGASTLCGRLVEQFGEPARLVSGDGLLRNHFPRPEVLAAADVAAIGLPRARADAIANLARAVAEGRLDLEPASDLGETIRRLTELPGIGTWTAHYVAMRALNEPDAFPATDLGLRRALTGNHRAVSGAELSAISESWRPWRAYAAMLLWARPDLAKHAATA